ncbi:NADP-dependent oxidoreductase [uncultured Arthrobacter sp.]|uniref:NADP-dependent oxidoreductase n=1 Tax=uncultured Arthrobacter sp. TaxID=114050 RepID=UPI0025EED4A7|nr:NADP-dependent oxidoreductase [uncultured Arthrobacter sp.]
MKALIATGHGPLKDNLEVTDLPIPVPGAGQMLVKIAAASINATDVVVVTGGYQDIFPITFPYVPGNDFAGTVTAIGPGVSAYQVGDEVFGQAMPHQLRAIASDTRPSVSTGALAEYAVFETDTPLIAHRPFSVSVEHAAALAIVGTAARAVMKTANIMSGETVFVIGATGGVGTALVPLLVAAGARITATAGSAADGELLRHLGVHEVVGFDAAGYPDQVDAVFNLVLPADRLPSAGASLRPGGRIVSIIFPAPSLEQLGRDDVDIHFVMDMEGTFGGMQDVADAAASGLLFPTIAAVHSLEDSVAAVVAQSRAARPGKVVVTM